MTGGIATGHSSADSPNPSMPSSSTPVTTFSSPMMTSPKEDKFSVPATTSVQSIPHNTHQQQQQHIPSATVTSDKSTSSAAVRDGSDVKPTNLISRPAINPEPTRSPFHVPQVKVESIPSSVPSSNPFESHPATVSPSAQANSHGSPRPPIKVKIASSLLGHRERSDSHGSSKNNVSSHQGDTNNSSSNSSNLKFKFKVDKANSYQVVTTKNEEKDEERWKEEERRKRKHEEVDRGSRRDSRDDKRSKDRKHHR